MVRLKVLSIIIVCLLAFNTVSYADNIIFIPFYTRFFTMTNGQVIEKVEISDLINERMEKNYSEEHPYMLHEKILKTLSVEPKITEDSGECQLFSKNPIEVYSLDELEGYAQYIVKGRILDEGQDMDAGGTQYTKTGFEISEIYRGDLEAGKTIYLKESYFQEDFLGTNYTYYYNGYTKSIVGDEYIFFLIKNPDFEEYGVVMASLSRYNLSANDTIGEDVDNQSTKKVFNAENHSKIKEEVLLKYQ